MLGASGISVSHKVLRMYSGAVGGKASGATAIGWQSPKMLK